MSDCACGVAECVFQVFPRLEYGAAKQLLKFKKSLKSAGMGEGLTRSAAVAAAVSVSSAASAGAQLWLLLPLHSHCRRDRLCRCRSYECCRSLSILSR
jgi:hypothetical protein